MEARRIFTNWKIVTILGILFFVNLILFERKQLDGYTMSTLESVKSLYSTELSKYKLLDADIAYEQIQAEQEKIEYFMMIYAQQNVDTDSENLSDIPSEYLEQYKEESPTYEELTIQSNVYSRLAEQYEYLTSYDDRIQQIQSQADLLSQVSIFSTQTNESLSNIEKTVKDYEQVANIKVESGNDTVIQSIMDYKWIHYIDFLIILILVGCFGKERKRQMASLVFATTRGRSSIAIRRSFILLISSVVTVFISYFSIFLLAIQLYGSDIGYQRMVQSMSTMGDFLIPLTIAQFLVFYIIIQSIGLFIIGLIIWTINALCSYQLIGIFISSIVLIVQYGMYHFIIQQSVWNVLKYCNIFYIIDPTEIVCNYLNLSVFGGIFNRAKIVFGVTCLIGVIGYIACILIYQYKRPSVSDSKFKKYFEHIMEKVRGIFCYIPFGIKEFNKVIIRRKGILIILCFLLFIYYDLQSYHMDYEGKTEYLNLFYEQLSGEVDKDTYHFIAEKKQEISDFQEEYKNIEEKYENGEVDYVTLYSAQLKNIEYGYMQEALEELEEKVEDMESYEKDTGEKLWILNDRAYRVLLGKGSFSREERHAMLLLFTMILLFSGNFAVEKRCNMKHMLLATPEGRTRLFWIKTAITYSTTVILWAYMYGMDLWNMNQLFGFNCLQAPVQSISFLEKIPFRCSILTFLIIVYSLRLLVLLLCTSLINCASTFMATTKAVVVSVIVLLVPSILYYIGIGLFKEMSISVYVCIMDAVINSSHAGMVRVFPYCIICLVGVITLVGSRKRWCHE